MGRALHLLLASKLLPCMLTTIIQNCGQWFDFGHWSWITQRLGVIICVTQAIDSGL
jgi:hypothetical protein